MCLLCDTYGTSHIKDEKVLKKAMAGITETMLNLHPDHMTKLVDAWMGMPSELPPEDKEKAEVWERSHR